MSEQLKPCPFCGCHSVDVYEGTSFRWRYAMCNDCGARSGEVRVQTLGEGTPEQWDAQGRSDAIAAWNTRSTE